MSVDFLKVQDSRIKDITPKLSYAVITGASDNTYQNYPSNSASTSNISFNISPPSQSVVMSREVMIKNTIKFKVSITDVPTGQKALAYGDTDSLQAFPFNSLVSNVSASINNTNVTTNLQDVKDAILKMVPPTELGKYADTAPALVDSFYKNYSDSQDNSELAGWSSRGYDKYLIPRGSHPLKSYTVEHYIAGVLTDTSITSTGVTDRFDVTIEVETTEPIILSPFIFGEPNAGNAQGFYGINQLNLVFNIDASMKRFWSTKNDYAYTFSLDPVKPFESSLLLNFLSLQPTDSIDSLNVVPYQEYPRYITPITNTPSISPGTVAQVTCQNIQLSKIPDLILVVARKPMSSQTCKDSASFFPIEQVSVNFNNQSGILSNASKQDLYKLSTRNGVYQTWYEWSGEASEFDSSSTSGTPSAIPTVGSVLCVSPALDLGLSPTAANGSVGQYNLQVTLNVKNNTAGAISPEIVIITVNSGIITTQSGNSVISTGLVTKTDVLESPPADVVGTSQMRRLVGGSLFGKILSLVRNAPRVIDAIGSAVGDFRGSGVSSGGVRSAGGVRSGGMMRKLDGFC